MLQARVIFSFGLPKGNAFRLGDKRNCRLIFVSPEMITREPTGFVRLLAYFIILLFNNCFAFTASVVQLS